MAPSLALGLPEPCATRLAVPIAKLVLRAIGATSGLSPAHHMLLPPLPVPAAVPVCRGTVSVLLWRENMGTTSPDRGCGRSNLLLPGLGMPPMPVPRGGGQPKVDGGQLLPKVKLRLSFEKPPSSAFLLVQAGDVWGRCGQV